MVVQMFYNELICTIRSVLRCKFIICAHRILSVANDVFDGTVTTHRLLRPIILNQTILDHTT
jgi:hypothetical protein